MVREAGELGVSALLAVKVKYRRCLHFQRCWVTFGREGEVSEMRRSMVTEGALASKDRRWLARLRGGLVPWSPEVVEGRWLYGPEGAGGAALRGRETLSDDGDFSRSILKSGLRNRRPRRSWGRIQDAYPRRRRGLEGDG